MKHVTLPLDYCMRTYLLKALVMGWSRWEDPLMAPTWPRTLQHTEHHAFEIALQKERREQKEQANANVPPPSCNACTLY